MALGGRTVLDQVGLTAVAGQTVGLVGPNGSGKTTLLRTLYRSLAPRAGLVTLDGKPVTDLRPAELARRLSVVGQETSSDLPSTVAETVLLGRSPHRSAFQSYTAADHELAASALRRVGARHLADRVFATLSGGEKQRVLIARALAQQADHLLLDEPTNHLDVRYQHEILGLVRSLGTTVVVVLHDLNLAARYCDHLVLLDGGKVVRTGSPGQVCVPEVLEPVYGVRVRIVDDGEFRQLVFAPKAPAVRRDSSAHTN
ncbi:ABC transporter ATP-binding protein [Parafrankia sp. FMc2]